MYLTTNANIKADYTIIRREKEKVFKERYLRSEEIIRQSL